MKMGGSAIKTVLLMVAVKFIVTVDSHNGSNNFQSSSEEEFEEQELKTVPGLFPLLSNVAVNSSAWSNATCGTERPEEYCKMIEMQKIKTQCGICDSKSPDATKGHPITHILSESTSTWQSPTLENGLQYNWVTVTLDLKQEYHIWDLIIKCGISPRPASWILEKSIDGQNFEAWQYFAPDEDECWEQYNHPPTSASSPIDLSDTDVVCSTQYSNLKPFEGGEVHTYVAKGRPGCVKNALTTQSLKEFAKARYVRLRFQKLNTPMDLTIMQQQQTSGSSSSSDVAIRRQFFYSIRSLYIGGQCICNGHAKKCKTNELNSLPTCKCKHYTHGSNCQYCRPLYNQRPWREGSLSDGAPCEKCQCFGHSNACYYDAEIDRQNRSLNIRGKYSGGGVCRNCSKHTTGINCEKCENGWYRPDGVSPNVEIPCLPCDCYPNGSTGICVSSDNSHRAAEQEIGSCECLNGFAGLKCDRCAPGFYNFPNCKLCPCDVRGSKPIEGCESKCDCKEYVIGQLCDECKSGYFGIAKENPLGCKQCYCSGVSKNCEESTEYFRETIENVTGWQIIYLEPESIRSPEIDSNTVTYNVDIAETGNFFWLAPSIYCGNKLTSYGTLLKFTVLFRVLRGDQSGFEVLNPDVVIVGQNGLQIAYGQNSYHDNEIVFLSVPLSEDGWYWFSNEWNDENYKQKKNVTREQMLSVLSDIKHVLVHARFNTMQTATGLLADRMDLGLKSSNSTEMIKGIEKCDCPAGYSGLSCENCQYGYVRSRSTVTAQHVLCIKCDCNNHSASCDPVTGQCGSCEHNTVGEKCELCATGYYGNAELSTSEDCKRCACPLSIPSNNFSPTCIANGSSSTDYFCDNCPAGHVGPHCEMCADGYYGDPLVNNSKCLLCDCNGGECDSKTGECIKCIGNTEGVHCEKCIHGFYGDPALRDCKACDCNVIGSTNSTDICDLITGQCPCKPNFTGRKCDRCLDGLGNITAGCIPCTCNSLGSVTTKCNPVTGECACKPGIKSPYCEGCYENYYGFVGGSGCKSCDCNKVGSYNAKCDDETGRCTCRPNIMGRTCDVCEDKYWNLTEHGCIECQCNHTGSLISTCDMNTGQCSCKTGVSGQRCDRCLEKYYGFSKSGCFACDECNKSGHICDGKNGRCVCPPFTEGDSCDRCISSAWNYAPVQGCTECECNRHGSISNTCDSTTGQCECHPGYYGRKCDTCAAGYYGFPKCRACMCNKAGTNSDTCDAGGDKCLCDYDGQCHCKTNVIGKKCDRCKDGTFDLHIENKDGCIPCFCFGRSTSCLDAHLAVSQIRLLSPRQLAVRYDANDTLYNFTISDIPVNPQEICYTNLISQYDEDNFGPIILNAGNNHLNITNNLRVIPGDTENVEIGVNYLFNTPLYWKLPKLFLGDKILSYGGYVQFTTETEGDKIPFKVPVLDSYPLMQLQGNNRFVLEHFPQNTTVNSTTYKVRLHESLWKVKNNIAAPVTREILMLTLQNLQHVLIRATDSVNFSVARLRDVTMDTAVALPFRSQQLMMFPMHGFELCHCPPEYSGSSCQNPNTGYYRYYDNRTVSATVIIQFIGDVRPCNCNNRSTTCDKETGFCKNCIDNTGGHYCNECAEGFYNSTFAKQVSKCVPCRCPSEGQNFGRTCRVDNNQQVFCVCKPGYNGQHCDRCSKGWYGQPAITNGSCIPCTCNPYGSVNDECDSETGLCICKEGIFGKNCSLCKHRQILTPRGCTACTDGCVNLLLDDLDNMRISLRRETEDITSGKIKPPWQLLESIDDDVDRWQKLFEIHLEVNRELLNSTSVVDNLENEWKHLITKVKQALNNLEFMKHDIEVLNPEFVTDEADQISQELQDIIKRLEHYVDDDKLTTSIYGALKEARYLANEIRKMNADRLIVKADDTLRYCSTIHSNAQSMENSQQDLTSVKTSQNSIRDKIKDIRSLMLHVNVTIDKVNELSRSNKEKSEQTVGYLQVVQDMEWNLTKLEIGQNAAIKEAREFLQNTEQNLHDLRIQRRNLLNVTHLVAKEEAMLSNLNAEYENKYVYPATNHADELWERAQAYINSFVNIKHDADIALKASGAYKNIVDAIDEAKFAAYNASLKIDLAFREYYSDANKAVLVNEAIYMKEKSEKLKRRGESQLVDIGELRKYLQAQLNLIKFTKENITQNEMNINLLIRQLGELKTASDLPYDIIRKAGNSSTAVIEAQKDTSASHIKNLLGTKLADVKSDRDIDLNLINFKIKEAEINNEKTTMKLDDAKRRSKEADKKFMTQNLTIADQLAELRNKILETRHIAEAIQLSMTSNSDTDGKCIRSYHVDTLEPTTVNTIVLTYAIKSNQRDGLLFYLQSSSTRDYMAIEIVNRKIRFVWDLGGGPGEITHPHHIQTAGDLHKDQHWYRIEAERIFNIGKLSVRPIVLPIGSSLANASPITNNSASGWGQFDTTADDRVWIGGVNSDRKSLALHSRQNGLVGCLHHVILDGRRIGLWHFKSELVPGTCTACVEGAEEHLDDGFYTFSGDGYAALHTHGSSVYDKYKFSVTMNFKTFDENAILFYAASSSNPDQYISLTLERGFIVLQIGYSADLTLELKTAVRYNNGNWTYVEVARLFYKKDKKIERAALKVGIESKEGVPSPPPNQNQIPDLSEPVYFIGGLSPGFKTPIQLPRSFLGCMSNIQINQEGYNPLRGRYNGVNARCSDKPLTVVGFRGNGYIELQSYSLKKKSSFSFSFATLQQDAFLMLTTTEGLSTTADPSYTEEDDTGNKINLGQSVSKIYYSVSLRRGQIDVRLNAGFGELRLATDNSEYGDGVFHSLSVIKTGKKVELRLDDVVQAPAYLPDGYSNIRAPGKGGGLFFGGIPADINVTSSAVSDVPLNGTIKNAIFNDQLIAFDVPIEFEYAEIGRQGVVPSENLYGGRVASAMHTRDVSGSKGGVSACSKGQSYSLEQSAVRFGDIPFSHVLIDFQKQTLMHKNFTLELKFRTFYPNGLLFIILGTQNKQARYFMAFLRLGRITVVTKEKRKFEMATQTVFNDGVWHKVKIMRHDKVLSLYADDIPPTKINVPRKLAVGNAMYVGGIPENSSVPNSLIQKIEPLKGCIQDVYVDGKKEDLVGEKVAHHKVGQCFPQIERGAYFPGDAYAIFKRNYYVGSLLELELEFRTSEKSGILLSISEPEGYPALSLEFNHSKIILSGDMGDRRPFKIEHLFPSEYVICDNKWHTIKAYYAHEELTLRVDGVDKKYWLSDNGHLTEAHTNSPLYIGGLPDNVSSGTLETRENFRGCLRNIVIGGEKCDWTTLPLVHNVLFSSCPSVF